MTRMVVIAALLCVLPLVLGECGDFSFASYYGDYMVLQRAPISAIIWGYTEVEGSDVTLAVGTSNYQTTSVMGSDNRPVWSITLNPENDITTTFTVEATSGDCTITLNDVLFGDVFICSGQSNMEFTMSELDDPQPDIDDSVNYPNVRTFRAGRVVSDVPLYDLNGTAQDWERPDVGSGIASFSALCWLFGRDLNIELGIPIGLIQSVWRGTRIEAWSSPEALEVCFPDGVPPSLGAPNEASALWNAMINPFLNFPIYGALWYQGEMNLNNPEDYSCALSVMVRDWRTKWLASTGSTDPLFPFGQVQLAPNRNNDMDTGFPDVRWAQTFEVGYTPNNLLPNVYTAIAIDLPDFDSPSGVIHPRYKRQIAQRMTYNFFDLSYNIPMAHQGPRPTLYVLGDPILLQYDNGTANLELRDPNGFEMCCDQNPGTDRCPVSGTWTAAPIISMNGSNVEVTNPCVALGAEVTGLRYLWRESPCPLEQCALYRVENELPSPPHLVQF